MVARVANGDAARYQAVLDRPGFGSSTRLSAYREAGWAGFDPAAVPYTPDQVRNDRGLYR